MINFSLQTPTPRAPADFDLNFVWSTLRGLWYELLGRLPYIMVALVALLLFVLAGRLVKLALITAGRRTRLDVTLSDLLGRLASAISTILGLFVAAVIIFPTFRPVDLIAGLGITSIVIGFAFRDVLQNFFAGLLILWRRPFIVGDEIKVGDYEGRVEEITARSTRLETYDGERAVLPNAEIYTKALLVRSAYAKRRVRLSVGIGYPDSIEKARSIIHHVLKESEGVLAQPAPWVYSLNSRPRRLISTFTSGRNRTSSMCWQSVIASSPASSWRWMKPESTYLTRIALCCFRPRRGHGEKKTARPTKESK